MAACVKKKKKFMVGVLFLLLCSLTLYFTHTRDKGLDVNLFPKYTGNGSSVKLIILWTSYFGHDWTSHRLTTIGCLENHCRTTRDRTLVNNADAIVWHNRDIKHPLLNDAPKRIHWQKWVLLDMEAPTWTYNDPSDLANNFNWTIGYRPKDDIFYPYGYTYPLKDQKGYVPTFSM